MNRTQAIAILLLSVSLSACQNTFDAGTGAPLSKSSFLKNHLVFSGPAGSETAGYPGTTNSGTTGTGLGGGQVDLGDGPETPVQMNCEKGSSLTNVACFYYRCSDKMNQGQRYNLQTAQSIQAMYLKQGGNSSLHGQKDAQSVACIDSQNLKSSLVTYKQFVVSPSCNLSPGSYTVVLFDPSKQSRTYKLGDSILLGEMSDAALNLSGNNKGDDQSKNGVLPGPSHISQFGVVITQAGKIEVNMGPFKSGDLNKDTETSSDTILASELLWDWNDNLKSDVRYGVGDQAAAHPERCDLFGSPLMVDTSANQSGLSFSSQANGIWFDILGLNATPAPRTLKKISWTTSPNMKWLVKPNIYGRVDSVDQMFGNNTFGPDSEFAEDGYAALAKYDGRDAYGSYQLRAADGFITKEDGVYSQLRLWSDLNGDGVSQQHEMETLQQHGVEAIDLNFDPNYREIDRHGNQILFKSIVHTKDRLLLIFDVWFNYLDQ